MECHFRPIELATSKDLCVQFRADSFVCSFGDARDFYGKDGCGDGRYIDRLAEFLRRDPAGVLHLWRGAEIIGQMEMAILDPDTRRCHVFLFYLIPAFRGRGLGSTLQDQALAYARGRNAESIGLRVSEQNKNAIAFYERHGWKHLGRATHDARLMEMELRL